MQETSDRTSPSPKYTVLVAEDEELLRRVIRYSLQDDFEIVEASTGAEALVRLEEHEVDLVLMDLMMPGVSGLDVLRIMHEDRSLRQLPVIVVTGRKDEASREEAWSLGILDYVVKPFTASEFRERLKAHLEKLALHKSTRHLNVKIKDPDPSNAISIGELIRARRKAATSDPPIALPAELEPTPLPQDCRPVLAKSAEQDESFDKLTRAHLFLLSRIDGLTTVRELEQIGGMTPSETREALQEFLERGLIEVG